MVERELLAECIARPDDDQPRLVWADAVGGERGELVVLQCTPRDALAPAELAALNRRERELLSRARSQLDGLVHRAQFRRGFVDAIDVGANALVEHAGRIARRAPFVTAVTLREVSSRNQLQRLLEHPVLARVRALDLLASAPIEPVRALVAAGALGRLEALGVALELDALEELADAVPARLRRLRLYHRGSVAAMRALAAAAPELRALDVALVRGEDPPDLLAGFGRLDELSIDATGNWAELVRPLAGRLERLAVRTQRGPDPDPRELARFTRLRALELGANAFGGELGRLAAHAPPSLRELRISSRDGVAVERIARALGPQLELLDLRDAVRIDPTIRCAGDTLVDEPVVHGLFRAGPQRRAEWHVCLGYTTPPGGIGWLVAESGLDAGSVWDLLERAVAYIGRTQSHVQVQNPSLARRHARIDWRDGRHWIRALGSTHGTRVDGLPIHGEVALADGARLELGTLAMRYVTDGARASELASTALRARDARS